MRTHYGPWQPCWISNQHRKHKSGRGPSNEHFWQVWLKFVLRFQRRRFKCEKPTDGRRTLTDDKSSHGLWPGELIKTGWHPSINVVTIEKVIECLTIKNKFLFKTSYLCHKQFKKINDSYVNNEGNTLKCTES